MGASMGAEGSCHRLIRLAEWLAKQPEEELVTDAKMTRKSRSGRRVAHPAASSGSAAALDVATPGCLAQQRGAHDQDDGRHRELERRSGGLEGRADTQEGFGSRSYQPAEDEVSLSEEEGEPVSPSASQRLVGLLSEGRRDKSNLSQLSLSQARDLEEKSWSVVPQLFQGLVNQKRTAFWKWRVPLTVFCRLLFNRSLGTPKLRFEVERV